MSSDREKTLNAFVHGPEVEAQPESSTMTLYDPDVSESNDCDTKVEAHIVEHGDGSQDADDDAEEHSIPLIYRIYYSTWCYIASAIVALPLLLFRTRWKHVTIDGVPASGLLLWLEIICFVNLISHFVVTLVFGVSYIRTGHLDASGHERTKFMTLFGRSIQPMIFFCTTSLSWLISLSSILCFPSHSQCSRPWIHDFRKVLLATTLIAALYLAKTVALSVFVLRSRMKKLNNRKTDVTQTCQAFLSLLSLLYWDSKDCKIEIESMGSACSDSLEKMEQSITDGKWTWSRILLLLVRDENFVLNEWSKQIAATETSPQSKAAMAKFLRKALAKYIGCIQRQRFTGEDLREVVKRYRAENGRDEVIKALKTESIFDFFDLDGDEKSSIDECIAALSTEVVPCMQIVNKGIDGILGAIKDVEWALSFALLAGAALIYAAFFSKNFGTWATPLWTSFTALGFAISGVATEFFSSCSFVFRKQPYDVGDRVQIDDGKDLVVSEIHLNHTVFHRLSDNLELQTSHQALVTKWITNHTRTKNLRTKEERSFVVGEGVLFGDRQDLQDRLNARLKRSRTLKDVEISCVQQSNAAKQEFNISMIFAHRDRLVNNEHLRAQDREAIWTELKEELLGSRRA